MLKNITLSAQEEAIKALREVAKKRGTTANQMFRDWITSQTAKNQEHRTAELDAFFERMRKSNVNAGRKFTREEMNER